MDDRSTRYRIPRLLDAYPKFLIVDMDTAIIFMGFVVFGLVLNQFLSYMFVGVVCSYGYQRLKAGRSPYVFMHMIYWYLPTRMGMRVLPSSFVREFIG